MSHFLVIYELVPEATYYTLMEATDENKKVLDSINEKFINSDTLSEPQEAAIISIGESLAAENQKFGLLENPVTIEGVYITGQLL